MKGHMEVVQHVFALLDTIEEGIVHLDHQIESLDFESMLVLTSDLISAVLSIKVATEPFETQGVHENLLYNQLLQILGTKEYNQVKALLPLVMVSFLDWKKELHAVLKPYRFS